MQTYNAYAVFDKKGLNYDVPFFAKNDLFATRKFTMDCRNRNQQTMISNFKDDFELHLVGQFSIETGEFKTLSTIIVRGEEVQLNEISNEA